MKNSSFTDGRIYVKGKSLVTGEQEKRADYILYYKPNIPIAIIEAKDNNHSIGAGMQQALDYATILDIPIVPSAVMVMVLLCMIVQLNPDCIEKRT